MTKTENLRRNLRYYSEKITEDNKFDVLNSINEEINGLEFDFDFTPSYIVELFDNGNKTFSREYYSELKVCQKQEVCFLLGKLMRSDIYDFITK